MAEHVTHPYTNALVRETSPYLLQHAHNPVDWYAWGPEAFELSRRLDKPIFLSIGYSTCYWCHVMERQCFENPAIAAVMNERFVNIKVDREERPDVDDIYMLAVQVMTGQGGWPMSVFLTAPGSAPGSVPGGGANDRGLKPFYAGTYFPPEPAHGRAGFPQILTALSDAWKNRRSDVLASSEEIARTVQEHLGRAASEEAGSELNIENVSAAANRLLRSYDPEHGGFGSAPKFPTPSNLFLLLDVYANNPNQDLWNALAHTLDRMARGGMYDQIGGGFHRYSTDEQWLVPHFEKMLYDNGQLVEAYLIAEFIKPDGREPGLYRRIVRQTCDYVLREMTDSTGAFWSAQDAEVDALEGGNYLWRPPEVMEAIGDPKMAALAVKMYGLDGGPNFRDPHHADALPGNVLYLPKPLNELAQDAGLTLDALLAAKQKIDSAMLAARAKRKQPSIDDKVLAAWNGMMIAGMARAGRQLNEPRYASAAAVAADTILSHMRTPDGGLLRSMRQGHAKIPGFLDDYAFFIHGLIELHHPDADARWLDAAKKLMDLAATKFSVPNGGGYYDTLADQPDLFVRTRSTYDGAIPSANSQMVHNLLDLFEITKWEEYLDRAIVDLRSFADALHRQGHGMARMQQALLRAATLAPRRFTGGSATPSSGEPGRRRVVDVSIDTDHVDLTAGEAVVTLTLHIGPEYHVNAHEPGRGDLIPTSLELRGEGVLLKASYPSGRSRKFPFADQPIVVYEGEAEIEAVLRRAGGGAVPAEVALILTYQVCTEMSCLEPRTLEIPVTVQPEPGRVGPVRGDPPGV